MMRTPRNGVAETSRMIRMERNRLVNFRVVERLTSKPQTVKKALTCGQLAGIPCRVSRTVRQATRELRQSRVTQARYLGRSSLPSPLALPFNRPKSDPRTRRLARTNTAGLAAV